MVENKLSKLGKWNTEKGKIIQENKAIYKNATFISFIQIIS